MFRIWNGLKIWKLPRALRGKGPVATPVVGLPVACLLIAPALFLGGITESAAQGRDSRRTTQGLKAFLPGDERADFLRAVKPSNTGATSSILMMIDTSRGMAGRRLSMAKRTAIQAIGRALRTRAEIAVLAFSGACIRPISKWIGFSIDRERLVKFVGSLKARGRSALGNALREAAPFLEKSKSPSSQSQTVLLFARGHDNCVNIPVMKPELREKDPETRHRTMVLGILPGRSETRRLKRIANTMGGEYISARNRTKMIEMFHDAMDSLDMLDMLGKFGGGRRSGALGRPPAGKRIAGKLTKSETCRRSETIPHNGRRFEKFCGTPTVNGRQQPAVYICGASEKWVRSNIYNLQDGIRECRDVAVQSRAG